MHPYVAIHPHLSTQNYLRFLNLSIDPRSRLTDITIRRITQVGSSDSESATANTVTSIAEGLDLILRDTFYGSTIEWVTEQSKTLHDQIV
jgi:hypothetical protein